MDVFKRFDKKGDGFINRDDMKHLFMSFPGWSEAYADRLVDAADARGDGKINYEEFIKWLRGSSNATGSGCGSQQPTPADIDSGGPARLLCPSDYVARLRRCETADLASLGGLRGRLCRGREPHHFARLGYGQTCFVLGPDGLKLFLDAAAHAKGSGSGAPLEMLLKIGYDILDIYNKLKDGWVFDLVVWRTADLDAPCANWEGVASVLEDPLVGYPRVSEHMRMHMDDLKQRGSGVRSPKGYASLQQEHCPEVSGYTFKDDSEKLTYDRFCEICDDGKCGVGHVRKFLYDCCGLNDLYAGTGCTVLANGDGGICEYLAVTRERADVTHAATALGAPTLQQCLQRISDMYEELNEKVNGSSKFHIDRWLNQAEVPDRLRRSGGRNTVSPRQVADMIRSGKPLDEGVELDGVFFRILAGKCGTDFATSAGKGQGMCSISRDMINVMPPESLRNIVATPNIIECLLEAGFTLNHMYNAVSTGKAYVLLLYRGTTEGLDANVFDTDFESIVKLCQKSYPDVVGPLSDYREEVLAPYDQAEYDKLSNGFIDPCERMTYKRFQASGRGSEEVRAFVNHTLELRGGWNGSGYNRLFLGGMRRAVIGPVLDLTQIPTDDFEIVSLGAPNMDEVVDRLCDGLEDLRSKCRVETSRPSV